MISALLPAAPGAVKRAGRASQCTVTLRDIHRHMGTDSAHGEHEEVSESKKGALTTHPTTWPNTQARLAVKEEQ